MLQLLPKAGRLACLPTPCISCCVSSTITRAVPKRTCGMTGGAIVRYAGDAAAHLRAPSCAGCARITS